MYDPPRFNLSKDKNNKLKPVATENQLDKSRRVEDFLLHPNRQRTSSNSSNFYSLYQIRDAPEPIVCLSLETPYLNYLK